MKQNKFQNYNKTINIKFFKRIGFHMTKILVINVINSVNHLKLIKLQIKS